MEIYKLHHQLINEHLNIIIYTMLSLVDTSCEWFGYRSRFFLPLFAAYFYCGTGCGRLISDILRT